jgi:hypothetical protein
VNARHALLSLTALALTTGCQVTSRPACDVEARDVADDDPLGDLAFTVADLVTAAAGASVVDLRDATGATHATTVEAIRGDEPATFLDATATRTETTRFGFGGDTSLIDVRCEDSVAVPMWLRVESADGAVAVEGDAVALNLSDAAPVLVDITRDLDLATDILPPPEGDADEASIAVQYRDGTLTSVSAWWDGENTEYEQAVEWP